MKWTQETFLFGEWGNSNTNDDSLYTSLQEALEEGNVLEPLVPTWIPLGYEIVEITAERTPLSKKYAAIYVSVDKQIRITVQDYWDKNPVYIEQSDGLVEEYVAAGVTYYLFENNKQVHAVWIVDSYECYIAGEVTIDELKMMIDSIEKG